MLHIYNGFYKNDEIHVDALMIDPSEYGLNENYIWFDVEIDVNNEIDISSMNCSFYLIDKNKSFFNQISQMDSPLKKKNNNLRFFVAFEFKSEFFYTAPSLGFYCNEYDEVELINLEY